MGTETIRNYLKFRNLKINFMQFAFIMCQRNDTNKKNSWI